MPVKPATAPLRKRSGETRTYGVNFGNQPELRDDGETLTGTPTVSATPSGLTISNVSVSGDLVRFKLSAGTADTDYDVKVTVETSGGHTLEETVVLEIRAK